MELGQIATTDHEDQTRIIHTFNSGDLVGEWEFYSRVAYQVSAVASKASTLHCLSVSAMQKMQNESPQIANTFAQYLLGSLANQLNQAKKEITTLQQERTETIARLTLPQIKHEDTAIKRSRDL